jgi:hypothetical protein
LSRPAIAHS